MDVKILQEMKGKRKHPTNVGQRWKKLNQRGLL